MRIGEIAVISPPGNTHITFIESICQNVENGNGNVCFGRLQINEQLALHLYGINIEENGSSVAWDLISPKILGYVVIFDWEKYDTLEKIYKALDFFSFHFTAPLMIVANVNDQSNIPLPPNFYTSGGIPIDKNTRFFFSQSSNSKNSKQIVATIIDILLEKFQ